MHCTLLLSIEVRRMKFNMGEYFQFLRLQNAQCKIVILRLVLEDVFVPHYTVLTISNQDILGSYGFPKVVG